jgi:DNA-binding transcriptional ArsR family regulator
LASKFICCLLRHYIVIPAMEPNKAFTAVAVNSEPDLNEEASMPVVLLIDAPWRTHLSMVLSPLAELACALHAAQETGHHPHSRVWVEKYLEADGGALAAAGIRWGPLWSAFKARYFLPMSEQPPGKLSEELTALDQLPIHDFAAMTAQALAGQNAFFVKDPSDLKAIGRESFIARMRLLSPRHHELAQWLIDDPTDLRRTLIEYLQAVAVSVFNAEWESLKGALEHERERKQRLANIDPLKAFDDMPIATVNREEQKVVFDKLYSARISLSSGPLLLVPTIHGNPHSTIKHYQGFPVVIHFPVGVNQSGDHQTVASARKRMEVVSHPSRLLICRDILRRPGSTTELAQRLNMTVPQISRHLRHLREAGLVTRHRDGTVVRYQLDVNALRRTGVDLLDALRR